MLVTSLKDCVEFEAGDHTVLRELLHPGKDPCDARYSLAHARLSAGQTSTPHRLRSTEVYYVLAGRGRMHIDGESRSVEEGDMVYIPPNSRQYIESLGPGELVFLCIVDPAWTAEDEIVEGEGAI